ncbi:MAG TPA: polyphosphate kinase 1 [Niabella sp.]|nr:polyphosphate kinase 1 [Niabella sp.]HQW15017.1 polyphosphate kinase 1 [Niabella sp.]HQX20091.1 polyphosphate kinase 1 [Niabella sp.]HQX40397.1 polyphosphate kinase 1 [Niabella sp.]HRB06696.1 polyphosphate kinase 1 [Niabella sp.]
MKLIPRDISWLSFNERVLQEAEDRTVPLKERVKFLGIFSNNRDEFFRVRVATLKRMMQIETKLKMHQEKNPQKILNEVRDLLEEQQNTFEKVWMEVASALNQNNIFLKNDLQLNPEQKEFIYQYFDREISANIVPLMLQHLGKFPTLRDKSIYLGVVLKKSHDPLDKKYAIIEVPVNSVGSRFIVLPSQPSTHDIMLLEDAIRANLPNIFSFLGYDTYQANIFKFTRDAELDIDNADSANIVQKLEKGLKNRKKGKPIRLAYDENMDTGLLEYLMLKLGLSKKDNLMPSGSIHNFRHFMDFPAQVFTDKPNRQQPFMHPLLVAKRVTDVMAKRDVLLSFPYHSFNPVIDMIREAAFDPDVMSIKIACYRLASQSKIINALVNAVRNGKEVTVMMELKARFDEEANLHWAQVLSDVGARVLIGVENQKVHAKICVIKKKIKNKVIHYGFVSTGNVNEQTAKYYGDHCLLTANRFIMADVNRIFNYLQKPETGQHFLDKCKTIIPSPHYIRTELDKLINQEIAVAKRNKPASIILKMNSMADAKLIEKLTEAAKAGVVVKLIVRGIFCMQTENKKFKHAVKAISIVDEYLEHARVWIFHNRGNEKVYISSADWMIRNIEHRVEATCPVKNEELKNELIDILKIQLSDNIKARILNNELSNEYVKKDHKKLVRSQEEIYNYLLNKTY